MHPEFNISVSIDQITDDIYKKHKKAINSVLRAKDNPEKLGREVVGHAHHAWNSKRSDCIYIHMTSYFLLTGEFELAWIANRVIARTHFYRDVHFFEDEENSLECQGSWDVHAYWEIRRRRIKEGKGIRGPSFDIDDPAFGERNYKLLFAGGSGYPPYDLDSSARYDSPESTNRYYLTNDAFEYAACELAYLILHEKYANVEEVIFRMKHALTRRRVADFETKRFTIDRRAAVLFAHESWLRARLEPDSTRQKLYGWTAIYWHLVYCLTVTEFLSTLTPNPEEFLIQVIADFDLLGDKQDAFLRFFKVEALRSCETTARKLMADPNPMATYADLGLPSTLELKAMYDEIGR